MKVYFPKSAQWFNFYTDEKIEGGQLKMVVTNEYSIPTFVRAGAFIPLAKPMQTTADYDGNRFDLHYYHEDSVEDSKGHLYNDNGELKKAREKGEFEVLNFESELEERYLKFRFHSKTGSNFSKEIKQINLILHNIRREPKRIKADGKKSRFSWNSMKKSVSIPLQWNTKNKLKIDLKLRK